MAEQQTKTQMSNDTADLFAVAPSLRAGSWLIILLLSCFIIWSFLAEIDEVVIAKGVVATQEQIKVIQHLEGGILENILVKEGDSVSSGQALLKLTLGLGQINRKEKQAELDSLLLTRARLEAQIQNKQPDFPEKASERHPVLLAVEQLAYKNQRIEFEKSVAVAESQIIQQQLEVAELKAKLSSVYKEKRILQEQFNISEDLLKKGLTSKLEHLKVKANLGKLTGQIRILNQSIPKAKANYTETLAKKEETIAKFNNTLTSQLNKSQQLIARISELLAKANDQNTRTEIKSPIDGIVKKMRYNTLQGVIKPGEAIMEIIPLSNNLIIEAELNPADRGYIKKGQKATVKVTAYDYSRYGGLDGSVVKIGADTLTNTSAGYTYYEVDIKTDKNHLGHNQADLPIKLGMEASIEIHTGSRTVFDYLLKPFLTIKNEAFRER